MSALVLCTVRQKWLLSFSTDLVVYVRFLSLLSTYDWENEPLLLNFNSELSGAEKDDIFWCQFLEVFFLVFRESDFGYLFGVFKNSSVTASCGYRDFP